MSATKNVVALGRADLAEVVSLLRPVKDFYPEIEAWLTKVFAEIGSSTTALGVYADSSMVGVALLRRKQKRCAIKLATLYVDPAHRGRGVASLLLGSALDELRESGMGRCYGTLDSGLEEALSGLLSKHGFHCVARLPNCYAPGRTELVYEATLSPAS